MSGCTERCVAMELGIAIPTQSNPRDWQNVKRFVASIVSRLPIGRADNEIQVGVVTYRGSLLHVSNLCCFILFRINSHSTIFFIYRVLVQWDFFHAANVFDALQLCCIARL